MKGAGLDSNQRLRGCHPRREPSHFPHRPSVFCNYPFDYLKLSAHPLVVRLEPLLSAQEPLPERLDVAQAH